MALTASNELCAELSAIGVKAKTSVSGSALTTFQIGGPLSFLVEPDSTEQLIQALNLIRNAGARYLVLGAGSNLLIPDNGVSEWVIKLGRGLRYQKQLTEREFEIGAAMPLMALSSQLSNLGLSGLEFAGGIPASFGGAVRMNAGAHGGEIGALITGVTAVIGGDLVTISAPELSWSYRHSSIPTDAIITSATIRLTPGEPVATIAERARCLEYRKRTQPLTLPSAGSVFRNPSQEQPAGRLLEQAGLKGELCGGAKVSELHANWIVNPERRATALDVLALIERCQGRVLANSGLKLEPEIVRW